MKSSKIDFTKGNLVKLIISFTIPVLISSIFNELFSFTNKALVGKYVSLTALSAVSATSWICNIFNYSFYGLGMGAGILIAKYYGANQYDKLKKALDTSIVFGVLGGLALTIISEAALPILMKWCNIGPDIYADAEKYLRVYLIGNSAVLTYQMSFFILRSFGDTKHPLLYLIISSLINLCLGVIFVRVLNLSVIGTALATIISQYFVDILSLRLLSNYDEHFKFSIKNIDFDFSTVKDICRLGIPAGIQNMLIAVSSLLIQSQINTFSNDVIAGVGAAETICGWAQMPSVSLGTTVMTMVSQNIGANNYQRVKQSIKEVLKISTVSTLLFMAMLYVLAPYIPRLITNSDSAIQVACDMIRITQFAYFFLNFSHIYNAACRGSGNVRIPMFIAIAGQVIVKYLFVAIGLHFTRSNIIIYLGSAVGYSVAGILAFIYFRCSSWTKENGLRD